MPPLSGVGGQGRPWPPCPFSWRCCFSTEAKSNIWERDFTDAITAGHWGSGLHVGKHVLANPGKRLLWQPSRQSVALILEKAKAAETEVVSNNNTTIRASELFTLVTLGRWCAGAQSHQAIRVLSGCCPWDPGLWKMQQAGLDFPVSRVQLQILIRF